MDKGTSQKERIPASLHPDNFYVDERSLDDLCQEAKKLADSLNFYESSEENPTSSWSAFFDKAEPYLQKITPGVEKPDLSQLLSGQCPPHLGLFLIFLKLFGHAQTQLNSLTASHLHFFYDKILGQEKKGLMPDKVYVFFGLDRKVETHLLPQGTPLKAGKDADGKDIVYTTDRQVLLNQGNITRFLAIHHQKKPEGSIYAFPEANSMDGFGTSLQEGQGWFPFGNPKIQRSSAVIGLGIASPMLFLAEGIRTIYITFSLTNENLTAEINTLKPEDFEVLLTGPENYFYKPVDTVLFQNGKLTFVIKMKEVDPPVVAHDENRHGDPIGYPMDWPMLKIVLKQGFTYSRYAFIQSLQYNEVTIKVKVSKVRSLLLSNDYGDLDTKRPFQPFGYSPLLGANLYVGLKETFIKPILAYGIDLKWKGLPENVKAYYEGYKGPTNSLVRNEKDFKVKASIRNQKSWLEIKNQSANTPEFPLFGETINLEILDHPGGNFNDNPEISEENGLIRLCLSSPYEAFGHSLYPAVYAKAILDQMQDKPSPIPHEPYTPIIENIELSYTAEEKIEFKKPSSSSFRFFHVEPFGIHDKCGNLGEPNSFNSQYLLPEEFHNAGNLYLGLENIQPPQHLTLFFEIKEVTSEEKPDLIFHYLHKTGWSRLSGNQILSDTTLGLKQTGILTLGLPEDATLKNSKLPLGYHWIRISVKENPERFDQILNVRTNAVTCTLSPHPSNKGLKVNALPPNTISTSFRKIPEIKQISQPYSSSGGRSEEKEIDYFTRVSEKLRHRMRGITSWDMERLVLEQFPEIYKVKCIPHADDTGKHSPGSIHIIVVPTIKQQDHIKTLKPMVPNSTLMEIRKYLAGAVSPHAKIKVTNPFYEEIKVAAVINFNIQADAGFYLKELQVDLKKFLSPWAFEEDADIQLGSRLYRSSIIKYIESRHYVNFIASIQLIKNDKVIEDYEISPDERSIIYSAEMHHLESIASDKVICQTNQGINQMIVDINFEIQ